MSSDPALTALQAILKDERNALLAADFSALSKIADRKGRALEKLLLRSLPPERLERLRSELARNQNLLQAATAGLEAVLNILKARRVGVQTSCYQKDGSQSLISPQEGRLAQKL